MRGSSGIPSINLFLSKVKHDGETDCWIWQATKNRSGYGQFKFRRVLMQAHRVAYFVFRGHIPAGKFALHKCDVKLCVNPSHLYLGGRKENMRDAIERGQWKPRNTKRDLKGHYLPELAMESEQHAK